MKIRLSTLCLAVLSGASLLAQNVGDEATAGFDHQRTGQNVQAGNFGVPFARVRQVGLQGVTNGANLTAFEGKIVVGEGENGIRYSIFDLNNPSDPLPPLSVTNFAGVDPQFDFSPSFAQGVLLLGGSSTSSVKAIRVSDGMELWQDIGAGSTRGRDPILAGNLAIYAGLNKVTAARADSGIVLWESPTTTLEAPLALEGDHVYFIDDQGALNALDLFDGGLLFSIPGVASDGSSVIASENLVFLTFPGLGIAGAVRTDDQSVAWVANAAMPASDGGLILAGDRLFILAGQGGAPGSPARITAVVPETGEEIWQAQESTSGLDHAFAANGLLVYYSLGSQRICVRDAATGVLLFSLQRADVQDMTLSQGRLLVLLPSQLEIFERRPSLFFAQTADGLGQSTLLALINLSDQAATAQVEFIDFNGAPMSLPVEGRGTVSSLQVAIEPGATGQVQTQSGDILQTGWTRVTADQELRGTALFQFSDTDGAVFEAGIGQSDPTGQASIFVLRRAGSPAPPSGAFSTALAAANPSQSMADLTLTLLDSQGLVLAVSQDQLEAGKQFARFIEELFPNDVGDDFEGTLQIRSSVPVVVTSLRTVDGLQLSSLPAGQIR